MQKRYKAGNKSLRDFFWNYPYMVASWGKYIKRLRLPFIILLTCLIISLLYVGIFQRLTENVHHDDTLYIGVYSQNETYNPLVPTSLSDMLNTFIYNNLITVDGGNTPSPDLADSWELTNANTQLILHLHPGVKWQDGQAFNTNDVLFSFNIEKKLHPASPLASATISILSPLSIEITLPSIDPNLWSDLIWPIFPAHKLAGTYSSAGTGPYTLTNIGTNIYGLSANPLYFKGVAHIKSIQVQVYASLGRLQTAYNNGEIDAYELFNPTATNTDILTKQTERTLIISRPVQSDYYGLFFNTKTITDKNIRVALNYAINKDSVVTALQGFATESDGPVAKNSWAYVSNSNIERYPYSISNTVAAMMKAGYTMQNGFYTDSKGQEFSLTIDTEKDNPGSSILPLLVSKLTNEGFKINIHTYTDSQWQSLIVNQKSFQVAFAFVQGNLDPDSLGLWDTKGESNISQYSNPYVDHYLEFARNIINTSERLSAYTLFQEDLMADAPAVFLYSPDAIIVSRSNIENLQIPENISSENSVYNDIQDWKLE